MILHDFESAPALGFSLKDNTDSMRPIPLTAQASGALKGAVRVPGDKSMSHRALILGLLSVGTTTITGLLEGDDVMATAAACRAFGATVTKKGESWHVSGVGVGSLLEPDAPLDFGNAGTGARLMMGVAATYDFKTRFTGDVSLCSRPMARVLTPLKQMGAEVLDCAAGEKLPLTLRGATLPVPVTYTLPVASAQVKSAILLAALNTPGRTTVIEPVPTRDHTEKMLAAFGASITVEVQANGAHHITINGEAELQPQNIAIPADPSSAAFPIVAALLVPGSSVELSGVMLNPTRTGLFTTLKEMGAVLEITNRRVEGGEEVGDITARYGPLHAVDVAATRAPSMIDEYPVLAVAASFASGQSTFHGLHELTVKESNRLTAIAAGLRANGVMAKIDDDTLTVEGIGRVKGGGRVETHHDHRIAMAFLIMGLASDSPVEIDDSRMIATSFPAFLPLMRGLGAQIA